MPLLDEVQSWDFHELLLFRRYILKSPQISQLRQCGYPHPKPKSFMPCFREFQEHQRGLVGIFVTSAPAVARCGSSSKTQKKMAEFQTTALNDW